MKLLCFSYESESSAEFGFSFGTYQSSA